MHRVQVLLVRWGVLQLQWLQWLRFREWYLHRPPLVPVSGPIEGQHVVWAQWMTFNVQYVLMYYPIDHHWSGTVRQYTVNGVGFAVRNLLEVPIWRNTFVFIPGIRRTSVQLVNEDLNSATGHVHTDFIYKLCENPYWFCFCTLHSIGMIR